MSESTLVMILRMVLIIFNFLKESGELDNVTDEKLKKNMQDIKEAVAKWDE